MRVHARTPLFVLGLTTALLASGCGDDDDDFLISHHDATAPIVDSGVSDVSPPPAVACSWAPDALTLTLPTSKVTGVLKGASRNASTTCTPDRGTGGPETFYRLKLTSRQVVDLQVTSMIDTVLAIRRVCDDPLTEVACDDNPPVSVVPPSADASVPIFVDAAAGGEVATPDPSPSKDAHLRAIVDPGDYFVLVDQAAPFGVGGAFELAVSATPLPAQATCSGAVPVVDGTHLMAESLDVGSAPPSACNPSTHGPTLYYAATIPPGQRLTATVMPVAGDRIWTPTIAIVSSCDQGMCLGVDNPVQDGAHRLRYANNGPTPQAVILAVGATDPAVVGAIFSLTVDINEPVTNTTCQAARVLTDGLVLRSQELLVGSNSQNSCGGASNALFYRVTLEPGQHASIRVEPRDFSIVENWRAIVADACGTSGPCRPVSQSPIVITNDEDATKTVIVEIDLTFGEPVLDLSVDLPRPPAGIRVAPIDGLVTSEAGKSDHFSVVLTSSPTSPVTVPVSTKDGHEIALMPTSLTFSAANWDKPQTVTVSGVNDDLEDGDQLAHVQVGPSSSSDATYAGLSGAGVAVLNRDDEPGFHIEPLATLDTSEAGKAATFTVVLNRAPSAPVHLPIASSNLGEGTVSPAELVFDATTWNAPQTVTVTGVDDNVEDGDRAYEIQLGPATSGDTAYAGIKPASVAARNRDDDYHDVLQALSDEPCPFTTAPTITADSSGTLYVLAVCTTSVGGGFDGGGGPPGNISIALDAGFLDSDAGFLSPLAIRPDVDASYATGDAAAPFPRGSLGPTSPLLVSSDGNPSVKLQFAVSTDGGRTFKPRSIPDLWVGQILLAGGGDATAYLVGQQSAGIVVARTEDAGATWRNGVALGDPSAYPYLVAARGPHLAVFGSSLQGMRLWTSADGAHTFHETPVDGFPGVVGMGFDDHGTLRIVVSTPTAGLFTSTDGGITFDRGTYIETPFLASADFGPNAVMLYNSQSRLLVAPFSDLRHGRIIALPFSDVGNAVRLLTTPNGTVAVLEALGNAFITRWIAPGATSSTGSYDGEPAIGLPSGVALSDRAVIAAFSDGNRIWTQIITH